jgi:hypothetical protein
MTSILTSIKKLLGINEEILDFDDELIMHINGALMVVNQIGLGEKNTMCLITSDSSTWDDLLGDRTDLEIVKLYVYLKVRLIFDPPTSAFVLDSITRQIAEMESRINIQTEVIVDETEPESEEE